MGIVIVKRHVTMFIRIQDFIPLQIRSQMFCYRNCGSVKIFKILTGSGKIEDFEK